MTHTVTHVDLPFIPGVTHSYLRFGRPTRQCVLDARQHVAYFQAGAIFCSVRWERQQERDMRWALFVLLVRPVPGCTQPTKGSDLEFEVLLNVEDDQVQPTLLMIDELEARGVDPTELLPTQWRVIAERWLARNDAIRANNLRRIGPATRGASR